MNRSASPARTSPSVEDMDPALPGDPFTRLRYHYGQLLGAEDFETEQRYFLLRSRLHNLLLHGEGVVSGLKIEAKNDGRLILTCSPGMAIDGRGREVWVPEAICLDLSEGLSQDFWASLRPADGMLKVYVVLRYCACLRDPVPVISPPCGEAEGSRAHSRIQDSYRLCLEGEEPEQADNLCFEVALHDVCGGGGGEDSPILLATIDVKPDGQPANGFHKITIGKITDQRHLLFPKKHVMGVVIDAQRSDIDVTGRRAGSSPPPPFLQFQAIAAFATNEQDEQNQHTVILVQTTSAVDPSSIKRLEPPPRNPRGLRSIPPKPDSVQVYRWDTKGDPPKWIECEIESVTAINVEEWETSNNGIGIKLDAAFSKNTPYQVFLSGCGPHALISTDGRILAGVAGEEVPHGCGRDACLFDIFNA